MKCDDDSQTTMSNTKKGEEEERTQLDDSNVRLAIERFMSILLPQSLERGPGVLSWNICFILIDRENNKCWLIQQIDV